MTNQNAASLEKADKLLSYLAKKIEENKPANVVHYMVDVLCTYYPTHSPYFAKVWNYDKELEVEKQNVRDFFKHNNSTSTIAQHFINAGFDCLDSLTFLTTDILEEIQAYNNAQWLPGHKQIFQNIHNLVKEFKDLMKTQKRTKLHFGAKGFDNPSAFPTPKEQFGLFQFKGNVAELNAQTKLKNLYNVANLSAEVATGKAVDAMNREIYNENFSHMDY